MNFKNTLLSGMLVGGGLWFVWVIFLISKTVYANWFFMSLKPELETGLFTYDYWYIMVLGLGIMIIMGLVGGLLYYGFGHVIFKNVHLSKLEKKHREGIKQAVSGKVSKTKTIKKHTKKK